MLDGEARRCRTQNGSNTILLDDKNALQVRLIRTFTFGCNLTSSCAMCEPEMLYNILERNDKQLRLDDLGICQRAVGV